LSFVVLLACIYQSAPAPLRVCGLVGLAMAILYTAMVTQAYMTIITVGRHSRPGALRVH
jgi:hypothetical protein